MADKAQIQPGFSRRGAGFGAPVEKPQNAKQTLRRLLSYFRSELKFVILMSAAVLVSVIASVLAPSFQSSAIDKIVSAQYGLLPKILAVMLAMHVIHGAATLTQGYISASLSQRIVSRLTGERAFSKAEYPKAVRQNRPTADFLYRQSFARRSHQPHDE